MFRLLIADDEKLIRDGIRAMLDWAALQIEIIGEAANGNAALQVIRECNPDIVLLDISMPGLNGLEVMRQAREQGFRGHIIILSGYADFSYAQEAIRWQVDEYLTKPVEEDELIARLETAKAQILSEKASIDGQTRLMTQVRKKAAYALFHHQPQSDDELRRVGFEDGHYQAAMMDVHLRNVTQYDTLTQMEDTCFTFPEGEATAVLLCGDEAISRFFAWLHRPDQSNTNPFVSCSSMVDGPQQISISMDQARRLMERRFFCTEAVKLLDAEALTQLDATQPLLLGSLLGKTVSSIVGQAQAFNRRELQHTMEELRQQLESASNTPEEVRLFLSDLMLQVKSRLTALYPDRALPFTSNAETIREVEEAKYLTDIIQAFSERLEQVMDALGSSSRESVLEDILYYLNRNFSDNLTLDGIAPLFGYNASYLGKLIKNHTGESFNSYVDRLRIQEAKRLLSTTRLKVYEISVRVGYSNVDYFHVKFRKYENTTPAEYRKRQHAPE